MSGIAGVLSSNNHHLIEQMLQKLEPRGNSSNQIWKGPTATLGLLDTHNYKKILDRFRLRKMRGQLSSMEG